MLLRGPAACRGALPPATCGASSPKASSPPSSTSSATTPSSSGRPSARSSTSAHCASSTSCLSRSPSREGGALAIMTAYNRLNGRWLTQRAEFLLDILRDEWGFEGLVMTDWFAVTDTTVSLGAGLDLEMPGPARGLGATVRRRRQERRRRRGGPRRRSRAACSGVSTASGPSTRPASATGSQGADAGRCGAAPSGCRRGDGVALERRRPPAGARRRLASRCSARHAVTPTIMGAGRRR